MTTIVPVRLIKGSDDVLRGEAFSKVLDNNPPASDAYRKYTPPIAVDVEGSTFYDIDHPPGAVGPKDSKPTTAWEIHPVTHIAPRS